MRKHLCFLRHARSRREYQATLYRRENSYERINIAAQTIKYESVATKRQPRSQAAMIAKQVYVSNSEYRCGRSQLQPSFCALGT